MKQPDDSESVSTLKTSETDWPTPSSALSPMLIALYPSLQSSLQSHCHLPHLTRSLLALLSELSRLLSHTFTQHALPSLLACLQGLLKPPLPQSTPCLLLSFFRFTLTASSENGHRQIVSSYFSSLQVCLEQIRQGNASEDAMVAVIQSLAEMIEQS